MRTHFVDKHPDPEKSAHPSQHIRKAFEEDRLTLCGNVATTSAQVSEDPREVDCLECQARLNLLGRYENPGLLRDVLNDIVEELGSFDMEYGTLDEHMEEAKLQCLAEDLVRVFLDHKALEK